MKAFTFSLERVLRWRNTTLKAEEGRLEQIRFSREQTRTANASLALSFSTAGQLTSGHALLTGVDLYALNSYTARLSREIVHGNQRMASLSEAIAKQMLVVSACDQNVRLLERLRERRRAEWQTEMNRELAAESGDFSASQWLRNKRDSAPSGEPE